MSDPAGSDPLYFWLAFVHPLWMLLALGATGLALRRGLRLRSARRLGRRRAAADYRSHLRLAKLAVAACWVGFAAGLASALWLRGMEPLASAHGLAAMLALALFTATAVLGHRLEQGASRAHDLHAGLAFAAVFAAALAFGTGFVLLP